MRASIPGYPHRRAGHCGSGALRDLLEYHYLSYSDSPLSEGMVFGLSGGFGFHFFELAGMRPPIYLVGRTAELESGLCEHLGIELDLRKTADPDRGWSLLREQIDAGRPTMVWADIKHLDYLRVRMHNTMHDIVVTGYDENEGIALVADNDREEIETCSLRSLAAARNSDAFPGPNRHATWIMGFPAQLPPLSAAVERALTAAVENMTGTGAPIGGEGAASGLEGTRAFAASYERWPELFGANLHEALRSLRVFIVKAGTGGAMFRSLQAQFLSEAGAMFKDPLLREAGDVYSALARVWVGLARSVADPDSRTAHRLGRNQVAEIPWLEAAGVEAMREWLAAR